MVLNVCKSSSHAYMCTKLQENVSKGFRAIERTRNHGGRTEERTDEWMDRLITLGSPQTSSGGPLINVDSMMIQGCVPNGLHRKCIYSV